jgi:hypothetical protein
MRTCVIVGYLFYVASPGAAASSTPAAIPANAPTARQPPSTRPARILRRHGVSVKPHRGRSLSGAMTGIGPLRNIVASIGTSECRLTGNRRNGARVANRGWKRPSDDPIPTPKGKTLRTAERRGGVHHGVAETIRRSRRVTSPRNPIGTRTVDLHKLHAFGVLVNLSGASPCRTPR